MFTDLPDLAGERFGAAVVAANDEFFASKEGLIKPTAPEWRDGVYTERGKWMDGWETRRRREAGHDWAIVRLGLPGIVRGVVIDTSFFTGNYPEGASIDGCTIDGTPSVSDLTASSIAWTPLLERTRLDGNTKNSIEIAAAGRVTHVRLNVFPDGGVARLRVHGEVVPDERRFDSRRDVDLAAMENGGFVVACSDMHYGNRQNLIIPGRSTHMGDGWETRRRRDPGHEWTVVRLARRGVVERVELDTDHYKGNAPGRCSLEWCDAGDGAQWAMPDRASWEELIPETPVQPHARHTFEPARSLEATHVRLNIFPDGGVARLRLFGRAAGAP